MPRRRFRVRRSRPGSDRKQGRVAVANASRLNSLFDELPLGSGVQIKFPGLRGRVTAHRLRPMHDIEDRRRFDFDDHPKTAFGDAARFVEKMEAYRKSTRVMRDVYGRKINKALYGRTIRIVSEDHPDARRGAVYGLSLPELLRSSIGFDNPHRVIICVRRRQRKQVMHALRKTGRGKGKQRRPRRNHYSSVRC